jgi:hypothetical protein
MANEDMVDATPRPPFTPKPWPPPRNKKKAKLVTVAEPSEAEIVDDLDFDKTSLAPVASEEDDSVTEDDSVAEDESVTESDSDDPTPPAKKQKTQATEKAMQTAGASANVDEKKKKKVEKVAITSDQQTPKPKKFKAKVRDEIDFAAKKITDNEVKRNMYSDMVKSMSAPKPPSQLQAAGGGRKLKREGAIADINALYKKVTSTNPHQNNNTPASGNDLNNLSVMDIDNNR